MRSSALRRALLVAGATGLLSAMLVPPALAGAHHRGDRARHDDESSPTTLFVSPTGGPSNSGASCTQARYSKIQSAVSAAAAGSTVVVCHGKYTEDVTVAQALTLKGDHAVIDATGKDNGILITASNVTVAGFTIKGATGEGILAVGAANPALVPAGAPAGSITGIPISEVTITHNVVIGNDLGTSTSSYGECQASGNVPGDCGEGIHLMSVADSTVSRNYVTNDSGGILLTDEFGPTHGNVIEHNLVSNNAADCGITLPSHNGLAVNPTTLAPNPALGGVYDNTVRDNTVVSNGLKGFGAGVLIAAPFPGSASYDNVIQGNVLENNGLAGVTMHSHAPGAYIGGNQVLDNLIGVNNLLGDAPLSPATGPGAAPLAFQADNQTTGILVWSIATATPITISDNTILGDSIGIWMNPTVSDPGAADSNAFYGVSTPVGP